MASYEQIFFDPLGEPLERAVAALAERLDARAHEGSSGWVLTRPIPGLESGAFLTGEVASYDYADSGSSDRDVFDGCPYYWSAITGPRRDGELAARAMRGAFDRIAGSGLGWPLVLTHDYDVLVATYDIDAGVRLFPPGTRTDGVDRHVWE